eukprot:TRINITY_DN662_c0_g1_i1.p1 TRINITY_DN662_c0_g1~~TRINITY_DN662_c0_g1_i1.p1  ORF type:complete len:331 (-),score=-14.24 TRINITY_DN662_c0_g1_i1:489-1481(-)
MEKRQEILRVYTLDDNYKTFLVDDEVTAFEVFELFLEKAALRKVPNLWIFEWSEKTCLFRPLSEDERVVDLQRRWPMRQAKNGNQEEKRAIFSSHRLQNVVDAFDRALFRFVICLKILSPILIPSPNPVFDHMIFIQAKYYVLHSKYPCKPHDAISLAVLQIHAAYGHIEEHLLQPGFFVSQLDRFIPVDLFNLRAPPKWEASIFRELFRVQHLSPLEAEQKYILMVQAWPLYGMELFDAKLDSPGDHANLPEKVTLGVGPSGVSIFERSPLVIGLVSSAFTRYLFLILYFVSTGQVWLQEGNSKSAFAIHFLLGGYSTWVIAENPVLLF